jgi:hypothetical protein
VIIMPLYRLSAPHWLKLAGYAAPVYCPLGSTVELQNDDVPSTKMIPLDEAAVAVLAKLESDESTAAVRRRRGRTFR